MRLLLLKLAVKCFVHWLIHCQSSILLFIYLFILSITSRHRRQSCSFSSSLSVSVLGYSDHPGLLHWVCLTEPWGFPLFITKGHGHFSKWIKQSDKIMHSLLYESLMILIVYIQRI